MPWVWPTTTQKSDALRSRLSASADAGQSMRYNVRNGYVMNAAHHKASQRGRLGFALVGGYAVQTPFTGYTMNFYNRFKSAIAGLGLIAVSSAVWASPATDALLDKIKKTYPHIGFSQVNETPAPGIYEAIFGTDMLYVDSSGTYFFPTMVNMVTRVNLGDERRAELNKVVFSDLPLNDAIKTVHGSGKHKIAVFADPNCGYCKKLESNLAQMKDVTVYTFAVGILGPDSTAKANAINCASGDKSKLWSAVLTEGARPVEKTCNNGISERNLALFKKFGLQGTPGIIFQNGTVLKGYAENKRIEEAMAKK